MEKSQIHEAIAKASSKARFFVRRDFALVWRLPQEETTRWEIFRGRLMDHAHTRQERRFLAWNVCNSEQDDADQANPLLSIKLDEENNAIHVVRGILAHVWAGYGNASNVVESREEKRWVRELVGTLTLASVRDKAELESELANLVRAAVEGTSRLPLNSVEAPLPAYSLGQLAYIPGRVLSSNSGPLHEWQSLAKLTPIPLEPLLRSIRPAEAAAAAAHCVMSDPDFARAFFPLFRDLFTNVSLSPYTTFVDSTLAFVRALVEQGALRAEEEADLWSWLLRQLGRHLNAYDLITYHYRGANYPDALLLDAVLKRYLHLIEDSHQFFEGGEANKRLRRRALRQACLVRRYYEGLPVPDAPTSPGENARVLPPPHTRVPDDQLLQTTKRKRTLYADEPLRELLGARAQLILAKSIADLADLKEWRELGAAVFVDRPFGWGKAVGEPDLTPLLAHVAFSPSIARRRAGELERLAQEFSIPFSPMVGHQDIAGVPASRIAEPDRPIVSLADARRVASDFVVLRTLERGLRLVFDLFDFAPVQGIAGTPEPGQKVVLARLMSPGGQPTLTWFDEGCRERLEMTTDPAEGFLTRRGMEFPAAGLVVRRIWDERGVAREADIKIPPLRS